MEPPIVLSQRERMMAAGSHAAILVPGIGYVVSTLIWSFNRSKSGYIRQQSLQALVFQMMQGVFLQVILLIDGILILISFQRLIENSLAILLAKIAFIPAVALLLYTVLGLTAAISCLSGKSWRYPFFGTTLAKYLGFESDGLQDHEDRLVASMCHAGIFYPGMGMVVPGVVLTIQQIKISAWLRFHAIQSLAVQAGWFLISHIIAIAETIFLIIPAILLSLTTPDFLLDIARPEVLVFGFAGSLAFTSVLILFFGPLLTVLATIGIVRLLKGNGYNYPFIGKIIRNRFFPADGLLNVL